MKIPSTLPQFNDDNALIIVAGKQNASLYKVKSGNLDKVFSLKVPRQKFAGSKMKTRSHGATVRSGSVKEVGNDSIISSFIHEFKGKLKLATLALAGVSFSKLIIFAPGQTKHKIFAALPYYLQRVSSYTIDGNFFNFHPLQLLSRLTQFPMVG